MPSKRSRREPGKLVGVHEAPTSVASVPEVGEAKHNDRAVDHSEALLEGDVAEEEALDETQHIPSFMP